MYRVHAIVDKNNARLGGDTPVLLKMCVTDPEGLGVHDLTAESFRVKELSPEVVEGGVAAQPGHGDFNILHVDALHPQAVRMTKAEFERESAAGYYILHIAPPPGGAWKTRMTLALTVQIQLIDDLEPLVPGGPRGVVRSAYCHTLALVEFT